MRDSLAVAAFVALLTALTYFVFPGHTYLQQDTQIYLPMLQQLVDRSLFAHELITSRPHLAWTLYDESAVALQRITRLDFQAVLTGQQLVFRAFGIWGVFLIGTSMGFSRRLAIFIAALFSLGAMIVGPQVLTIEYEPVPRGFAIPMILCAIGLALHQRWTGAAVAASAGLLYHAPTTAPFWPIFAVLLRRARSWKPVLIPAGALILLVMLSRLQPGLVERQPMMSTIHPMLAEVQKIRAAYNWISLWPKEVLLHYGILCAACVLAMHRLRGRLQPQHHIMFWGLLAIAVLSVPFSLMTLEGLRWSLIPQFQPARALLFITALAVILCSAAALEAAFGRRYRATFAWLLIPFIIPTHTLVTPPYVLKHAVLIVILAAAATGAIAIYVLTPRRGAGALAMAALGAYFAVPLIGGVRNYPALWNPNIVDLARWARTSSDRNAVFLFPYAGKDLHPGMFRAQAQRAVYVDWKGGGQVNYFEDLALEWWKRWQDTMVHSAGDAELAARGVSYVIVDLAHRRAGSNPEYQNPEYIVYRLR